MVVQFSAGSMGFEASGFYYDFQVWYLYQYFDTLRIKNSALQDRLSDVFD